MHKNQPHKPNGTSSISCRWRYWSLLIACCIFIKSKIVSIFQKKTFFIRYEHCHPTSCLHLMVINCGVKRASLAPSYASQIINSILFLQKQFLDHLSKRFQKPALVSAAGVKLFFTAQCQKTDLPNMKKNRPSMLAQSGQKNFSCFLFIPLKG